MEFDSNYQLSIPIGNIPFIGIIVVPLIIENISIMFINDSPIIKFQIITR